VVAEGFRGYSSATASGRSSVQPAGTPATAEPREHFELLALGQTDELIDQGRTLTGDTANRTFSLDRMDFSLLSR
jgi:hypothetical protein